jgi:chromosome segregation ATPase
MSKQTLSFTGEPGDVRTALDRWRFFDALAPGDWFSRLQDFGVEGATLAGAAVHPDHLDHLQAQVRDMAIRLEASDGANHRQAARIKALEKERDGLLEQIWKLENSPKQVVVHDTPVVASLESRITALLADLEAVRCERDNVAEELADVRERAEYFRKAVDSNCEHADRWQGKFIAQQQAVEVLQSRLNDALDVLARHRLDLKEANERNARQAEMITAVQKALNLV